MSWQFNSNGSSFQRVDTILGGAGISAALLPVSNPLVSVILGGAGTQIPGSFITGFGTAIRYGLGGGMDTYTFPDGGKVHSFSDGSEVIVDQNGKYIGSVHSSTSY